MPLRKDLSGLCPERAEGFSKGRGTPLVCREDGMGFALMVFFISAVVAEQAGMP
jgi:hypothetical protein